MSQNASNPFIDSVDKKRGGNGNPDNSRQMDVTAQEIDRGIKGKAREKKEIKDYIEKCLEDARKFLLEGDTNKSCEIAFDILKDKNVEKHLGEGSIYVLPAYLVLAESYIHEGYKIEIKLRKAEEYLIAASYNFLKYDQPESKGQDNEPERLEITQEEYVNFKTALHKIFSKLFLAQGNYTKSLDELKQAIYFESLKFGPETIQVSVSYYQMGNIFAHKKSYIEADTFYFKAAEIWYKYFKKQFHENENLYIDVILIREAQTMLIDIEAYFRKRDFQNRRTVIKAYHRICVALAFLYRYQNDENRYYDFVERIINEYVAISPDHPQIARIKELFGLE